MRNIKEGEKMKYERFFRKNVKKHMVVQIASL